MIFLKNEQNIPIVQYRHLKFLGLNYKTWKLIPDMIVFVCLHSLNWTF